MPTAAAAAIDLQQVAADYLAARENAIGYTHPDPRSWLADARPLMTPTGWSRLSDSLGDSGGHPAATAHDHQWSVQATVRCQHNPDAGPATNTIATLTCAVTDRTVDTAGNPAPVGELPRVWPYDGPQPPALLAMTHSGGQWLIDATQTGQAD